MSTTPEHDSGNQNPDDAPVNENLGEQAPAVPPAPPVAPPTSALTPPAESVMPSVQTPPVPPIPPRPPVVQAPPAVQVPPMAATPQATSPDVSRLSEPARVVGPSPESKFAPGAGSIPTPSQAVQPPVPPVTPASPMSSVPPVSPVHPAAHAQNPDPAVSATPQEVTPTTPTTEMHHAAFAHVPQHGFADGAATQVQPTLQTHVSADPAAHPTTEYPAFQQPVGQEMPVATPPSKSKTGSWIAALAAAALLGGIVGGGVAAVVAANVTQSPGAQSNGTLTLKNPDSASTVSGVAAVAMPSVVTLDVTGASAGGSGSGVIYSEDGYIITNAHVVTLDGAAGENARIRVKMSDGRLLDGKLVGVDPYADLAVVKVDAEGLPAVKVANSTKLNVGDVTVAIGAPLNLSNTVTSGVVSAVNRGISVGSPLIPQDPQKGQEEDQGTPDDGGGFPWDFRFDGNGEEGQQQQQQQPAAGTVTLPVIQTDASINPGNSGGALLNAKGELIGINVAIASTSGSSDTAGSVGLGFAIPSNLAVRVADALIDGEQPSHGLLGAAVIDSSQDTDADQNVAGGLVKEVTPQGAAEKAGLKPGDVITKVDGVRASDGTSVSALVRMNGGGSTVTIDYIRNGKEAQTEATLGTLEW